MYARAERGSIFWGMGISQLAHGTTSGLALVHLALLTGHVGREGTGLNPLRGQNNVQGASDSGAMPYHFPGYMLVDEPGNAERWEKAWHVEPGGLSRQRGLTTTEILSHAHPGGVRALYIMGENPMMTEPNLNVARDHMRDLEFLVAQDLFINESGAFADVFLPAASWAEKDGTFTNTDRRVQRVRQAIAPRGQSRPDWEIICDLANRVEQRLGRPNSAYWGYEDPEEIWREMAAVVPAFKRRDLPAHRAKWACKRPCPTSSTPARPSCLPTPSPPAAGASSRSTTCPPSSSPMRSIRSSSPPAACWSTGTAAR